MRRVIICGFIPLLFINCVTLVDRAGQALDGSAFAEKKTAVYRTTGIELREVRTKAGESSVIITLEQFPSMKLRGSAPDDKGEFYIKSLDYLGGNTQGWNEYRLELLGMGSLRLSDTEAVFSVPDDIETVEITSGRIRRYDTRITGTEAISSLRNRRERILALAEWLNERGDFTVYTDRNEFEKYWKPILFPEMVKKKKRPQNWEQAGDTWEKAEDIKWNTSYTERVYPELLWGIRNSGTLLRDWEEALEWVYIECQWRQIKETLAQETKLARTKK